MNGRILAEFPGLFFFKGSGYPDLHMPHLTTGGGGNLFTVFGEPDIEVHEEGDDRVSIEVAGIDMYKDGEVKPYPPTTSPCGSSTPITITRISASAAPISSA